MNILLLEDDFSYNESITEFLTLSKHKVDSYFNGKEALEAIFNNDYDIILLDIMVPEITGYEILKRVRKEQIDVPIILITSLTDIDNLSIGYELGCNDYIRKPFSLKELKLRINQAVNSFHYKSNSKEIALKNNYTFNIENLILQKNKKEINLTNIEKKIIEYFIKKRGYFSSCETIITDLWEGNYISNADLRMHIKRIRNKTDKDFIVNARGLGYRIEKN